MSRRRRDGGNLALDEFAIEPVALARPAVWWNVLKNVRSQVMPPSDHDRLTPAEIEQLTNWIKFRAFQIDPENPDREERQSGDSTARNTETLFLI